MSNLHLDLIAVVDIHAPRSVVEVVVRRLLQPVQYSDGHTYRKKAIPSLKPYLLPSPYWLLGPAAQPYGLPEPYQLPGPVAKPYRLLEPYRFLAAGWPVGQLAGYPQIERLIFHDFHDFSPKSSQKLVMHPRTASGSSALRYQYEKTQFQL